MSLDVTVTARDIAYFKAGFELAKTLAVVTVEPLSAPVDETDAAAAVRVTRRSFADVLMQLSLPSHHRVQPVQVPDGE